VVSTHSTLKSMLNGSTTFRRGGIGRPPNSKRTHPRPGRHCVLPLAASVCFMLGAASAWAQPPSDVPLELRPYRVLISVGFAPEASFTPRFRQQVRDEMARIADRTFYQMWDCRMEENTWLTPANADGLSRVTSEVSLKRLGEVDYDKVFLLTVQLAGSRQLVAVREWDAATRELGPIFDEETPVRRRMAEHAMSAVARAFRPVLSIESSEDTTATLRLRAGAFPPPDPAAEQLRPGDVLQAFLKSRDFDGNVGRIQLLRWTYLVVDDVQGDRVTCTVASRLRAPLRGARRRVESLALATRVAHEATRLKLVLSSNTKRPLVGHQVRVLESILPEREAPRPSELFVTDRRGTVMLQRRSEGRLVWIYVLSGNSLLAKFPYVPGSEVQQTLGLSDDSIRLRVEGELDLLQGDLIDLVAKRAQHILLARKLADLDQWERVDEQLSLLRKLPNVGQFRQRLSTIRVPAIEAVRADKNSLAESRITKICTRMSELIDRYVDDDKIRSAEEQIAELRPDAGQ